MELKAYLTILKRRFWLVALTLMAFTALTLFAASKISPKYRAEISLRVQTPVSGTTGYLSYDNYYANRLMNTYARIASSDQVEAELKKKLNLDKLPDLEVVMVPDSEIIQINVEDSDPKLAAETANALGEILISKNLETEVTNPINESLTILSQRLEIAKQEVDQAQKDYDILIDPSALINAQVAVLDNTIRLKEVEYQALVSQYQQAAMEEMNQDLPTLKKKAKDKKEALSAQINTLQSELDTLNANYQTLSARSSQYQERLIAARQSVDSKEQAYQNLQTQYDSAMIAKSIRGSTQGLVVLNPAIVPDKTTGLQPWMIRVLGVLAGIGVAMLLALLVDGLDPRVWTAADAERLLGKPVFGRIPHLSYADRKDLVNNANLAVQQSFWALRTRLNLNYPARGKILLITSADPGDGKSVTILGLASYSGKGNQKTLVIDGDMRRPNQHKLFKVTNTRGLSSVLCGDLKFVEALHEEVKPGVDLLASGPVPEHPLDLLSSQSFVTMLGRAREQYELILIDAPALIGVTDASVIAQHVDGVIIVIRLGETRPEAAVTAEKQLTDLKAPLDGLIITHARAGKSYHYYRSTPKGLGRLPRVRSLFEEAAPVERKSERLLSMEKEKK